MVGVDTLISENIQDVVKSGKVSLEQMQRDLQSTLEQNQPEINKIMKLM